MIAILVSAAPSMVCRGRGRKFSVLQALEKSRNREGISPALAPAAPSIRLASVDDRFGLDLDLVIADQAGNLQQSVGGADFAEIAAVDAGDGLALRGVLQVNPSAHDVLEPAAERDQARGDFVENKDRLPRGVARADDLARAVRRGGAADQDAVLHAHRAAVAGDRFPCAPRVDAPALGSAVDANRLIDLRQTFQMVAEVA